MTKKKVPIGAVMIMWTFTIFLGMFWYYLPANLGFLSDIFLVLPLISAAVSFRVSIRRKA